MPVMIGCSSRARRVKAEQLGAAQRSSGWRQQQQQLEAKLSASQAETEAQKQQLESVVIELSALHAELKKGWSACRGMNQWKMVLRVWRRVVSGE